MEEPEEAPWNGELCPSELTEPPSQVRTWEPSWQCPPKLPIEWGEELAPNSDRLTLAPPLRLVLVLPEILGPCQCGSIQICVPHFVLSNFLSVRPSSRQALSLLLPHEDTGALRS